jgi:class 3 adenylate cyclase
VDGEIRFTQVGSARVGYAIHGAGDLDIVYAPGLPGHLDVTMEQPRYRHYIDGLMELGRVIRFDRRGTGVSDSVPHDAPVGTWELWADDLEAVLRAADSRRVVIIAANDAGPGAMLFAATHPDLTASLILFNTTACFLAREGYPGHTPETAEFVTQVLGEVWGTESSIPILAPSLASDAAFCRWYARFQRAAVSPGEIAESMRRVFLMDCRAVLPEIRCPTLVLHREDYFTLPLEQGAAIAEAIPGAVLEVVPGGDAPIWAQGVSETLELIAGFLGRARTPPPDDRVFCTVLFTDIVASTETAIELGDHVWRKLINDYEAVAYDAVRNHEGRFVKATGDGTLATFDRPTRALRCALEINDRARELGISVRAGVHAGPLTVRENGDISGIAVNAAARVLGQANAREILSSEVLLDLVGGDEVEFTPRGEHDLKGFDGAWPLYAVSVA